MIRKLQMDTGTIGSYFIEASLDRRYDEQLL